jgi:hypothetical protein
MIFVAVMPSKLTAGPAPGARFPDRHAVVAGGPGGSRAR